MQANPQTTQNPGIAKIRALLLAAQPGLDADARALSVAFRQPLHAPGDSIPDRSPAVAVLIEHLKALRSDVEGTTVEGAAAVNARDLTAHTLLETEQAMAKLAETYAALDQRSATILLSESNRLLKAAKASSTKAGKALGIPWPLK